MKRSFRDAIVGFSLLGGIATFAGTMLWLQGIKIKANTWHINASFQDASGLSELSPVTYRGILIGSVRKIQITPESVKVKIEINDSKLQLNKPIIAKVSTTSLLGGDVQISLINQARKFNQIIPLPKSKDCPSKLILCKGDEIKGESLMSISTLTEEFERMLQKADNQKIISNLVESTKQFDLTQKNLDELIMQVKNEIYRAEPFITNLNIASEHIKNILASIDNSDTLNDLKQTAKTARSLTNKMDSLGLDIQNIKNDAELMNALRNVTIGLGELFNELYPTK